MQTKINKAELLAILNTNKGQHKSIFDEAVEGYRQRALDELQRHIDRIARGKMEKVYVSLPVPEEHTRDYDRAIRMVELHTEETITLTETDVASYVMDDWAWKRQFLASNSQYSATAQTLIGDDGF